MDLRASCHHLKCMLNNREDSIESLTLTIRELQETVRDIQDAAVSAQTNLPFASGTLVFSDIEEKSNALEKELGSLKVQPDRAFTFRVDSLIHSLTYAALIHQIQHSALQLNMDTANRQRQQLRAQVFPVFST